MVIWKTRVFWQPSGPIVGYISLNEALDTSCINVNQRIVVASKIVRIFHGLHFQNIIQRDLKAEDIFVKEANKVITATMYFLLIPCWSLKKEFNQIL